MRYIVSIVLVITLIFNVVGCTRSNSNTAAYVGSSTYFYDNKLFYIDKNNIKFISYDTYESYYFCFEPSCKHNTNDCISCIEDGIFVHLVVDEDSSTDGVVLYASYSYLEDTTSFNNINGIMKIDSSINKKVPIIHNTECESINQVTLWNNKIFFSATKNDYIYKIFSVDMDGKNLTQLTPTAECNYYIHSISDDIFYYFDDLGNFYGTYDFVNSELIHTSKYPYGIYIKGGYLYYCDDEVYNDNANPELEAFDFSSGEFSTYVWPTYSYSYYRIPISDPSQSPEKVTSGVLRSQKMLITDDYFYLVSVGHKYLGSYLVYDSEYKLEVPIHVAVTTDGIQKIDLKTLEIERIDFDDNWRIAYIIAADDEKIIFYGENMQAILENQEQQGARYVVYDIAADTYTVM